MEGNDLRTNTESVSQDIGTIKTQLSNIISEIEGVTATVDTFANDNAGILGDAFLEGYQPTKQNLSDSCDKVESLIGVTDTGNDNLAETGQSVAAATSTMMP